MSKTCQEGSGARAQECVHVVANTAPTADSRDTQHMRIAILTKHNLYQCLKLPQGFRLMACSYTTAIHCSPQMPRGWFGSDQCVSESCQLMPGQYQLDPELSRSKSNKVAPNRLCVHRFVPCARSLSVWGRVFSFKHTDLTRAEQVLVADRPLSTLPLRPVDESLILRNRDIAPDKKRMVYKLNVRTDKQPVVIRRSEGRLEKVYRTRCTRCDLVSLSLAALSA